MFLFWNTAKIFVREPYNIQVSWAYEDTPIRDCSPEDEIDSGFLAGYLEDLVDKAVAEADRELIRLNREILKDVQQVDKQPA